FDIVLHHVGDVFAYKDFGSQAPWSGQPYTVYWRDENGNSRPDWTDVPANPPANAAVWPQELHSNIFFQRQGNAFSPTGDLIDYRGDFQSLKGLNTDLQDNTGYPTHNILIRAYQYLIARYDIDGFRIDTLKYISPDFERIFANAMREFALSIGKKNFFTFGEVYDNEETIARFIGRNTLEAGDVVGVDAAPDFPCLYYGTEQGLAGAGNIDWAVREALWGKPGAFDQNFPFYRAIQQLAVLRSEQPAVRFGRYYFRPLSGDGIHFGISTSAAG